MKITVTKGDFVMTVRPNARQIIDLLGLRPLPAEGGMFAQGYCSAESIPPQALPERYPPHPKPFSTAIYYLLTNDPDSFSALHRLPTDEIFHFYLGDPVETLLLFPDGSSQVVILGPDLLSGQKPQLIVPRGVWQGSHLRPGGEYALLGSTMAPGFTEDDYEGGERETLIKHYPHEAERIRRLTRDAGSLSMD